jgi:hypothetical protein
MGKLILQVKCMPPAPAVLKASPTSAVPISVQVGDAQGKPAALSAKAALQVGLLGASQGFAVVGLAQVAPGQYAAHLRPKLPTTWVSMDFENSFHVFGMRCTDPASPGVVNEGVTIFEFRPGATA